MKSLKGMQVNNYGIDIWGDGNFIIEDGVVKINAGEKPSLIDIVKKVRSDGGNKGPLLIRFPHLTLKQIDTLYKTFNNSIKSYNDFVELRNILKINFKNFKNPESG